MNILTFDIEEWFHILDNPKTESEKQWVNFESRLESEMDIIFEILKNNKISATFFIVGWVAEKYPKIVKKIDEMGFQIGSHTHMHQLLYKLDRKEVFDDINKSIETLEQITGKKVEYLSIAWSNFGRVHVLLCSQQSV